MEALYLIAKRSRWIHPDFYKDTAELLGLIPPPPPRVRPDFAELMMKPPEKIVPIRWERPLPSKPAAETEP